MKNIAESLSQEYSKLDLPTQKDKLMTLLEPLKDKSPYYMTMYNHINLLGDKISSKVLQEHYDALSKQLQKAHEAKELCFFIDTKLSNLEHIQQGKQEDEEHTQAEKLLENI